MPIYEYDCPDCQCQFEEILGVKDTTIPLCPHCGKKSSVRKVSNSAFHLKGGGWYQEGYGSTKSGGESGGSSSSTSS